MNDENKQTNFYNRINELYEEARDKNYRIGRKMFADLCGITKGQLNGYLCGDSEPSTEILKRIAEKQEVSVAWLVGATDKRNEPDTNMTEKMPAEAIKELYSYVNYLKFKYKVN